MAKTANPSWPWNITVHTVSDIYYRIYSIPTHDKKPVAVTTIYSFPDDGHKAHPKHVELLTPNKEHKKLHLVGMYMISI